MANKSVLTIIYKLLKEGNADKEVLNGLKSVQKGVGTAMAAFAAFAGVAYTVNKALGATVGTFVDYAAQVREMSRLTGAGAEETSRLIQMADDLTISYEDLQKSLWFASKNGVEVNVESLANLADQYVALQSPMEQADFLAKNFGKSGMDMAKMLEQGGDAVKEWANSIEGSLVITDQAVQEAREYELALDQLNDQWEAMKVGIGQAVVPALNEMLFALNNNAEIIEERTRLMKEGVVTDFTQANTLAMLNVKINEYTDGLDSAGVSYRAWAEHIASGNDALTEQGETIDQINQRNTDMLSLVMNLQSENDRYNESLTGLTDKMSALKLEQEGYLAGSTKYEELRTEIDQTGAAIEQLATEHEMAGKRIAFSLVQQKMAVDGLSDAEFESLLKIGQGWGILDATTVTAAQNMIASVNALSVATMADRHEVNRLRIQWEKMLLLSGSSLDLFVNIHVSGRVPSVAPWMGDVGLGGDAPVNTPDHDAGFATTSQFASGGQLGKGWAMVGEQGFEIVSPSGFVFSHEVAKQMIAGGVIPEMQLAVGGDLGGGVANPASTVPHITFKPGKFGMGTTTRTVRERGELSGSTTAAITSAVVNETVAPLAESTAQAAQSAQTAQEVTAAEMQATRNEIARGNTLTAQLIEEIKRNNATVKNSILAGVEQLRG